MTSRLDPQAALAGGRIIDAFHGFAELRAGGETSVAIDVGFAWSCERLGRFDLAVPIWQEQSAADPTDQRARWRLLHGNHELGHPAATEGLIDWVCHGPAHRGALLSASRISPVEWGDRFPALLRRFDDFPDAATQVHLPRLLDRSGDVGGADALAGRLLDEADSGLLPVDIASLAARLGEHERFEESVRALMADQLETPSVGGLRALTRFLLRPTRIAELRSLAPALPTPAHDPLTELAVAEILVAVGLHDRATQIVEHVASTPAAESVPGCRLLAWADARRGDFDSARDRQLRALWPHTRWHRSAMQPQSLRAVSESVVPSALVVLGAMGNEAHNVESYLDHHRALAVERFWIVDDHSSDGTSELLAAQPDVDVFEADTTFAEAGNGCSWFAALARRLEPRAWVSMIDADERLVLPPGFDSVRDFLGSLPADIEAVHANVIDVFAGPDGAPWFDDDHVAVGRVGAPYRGLVGGVRYRMLSDDCTVELVKTAFVRAGLFQGLWSTHEVLPVRVASVSVALVHTKLLDDVSRSRDRANGDRRQAARLSQYGAAIPPTSTSVRFRGADQLAACGLVGPRPPAAVLGG